MTTPLTESPQAAPNRREARWVSVVFVAVVFGISMFSGPSLASWLGAPPLPTGGGPPWDYIRRDFFDGLSRLLGILVLLPFAIVAWRRKWSSTFPLLWLPLLLLPGAIVSISIYLQCDHFFDHSSAVCPWPTFEAYMASKGQVTFGTLGAALLVFAFVTWRKKRRSSLP
jgi:hypothetical protein